MENPQQRKKKNDNMKVSKTQTKKQMFFKELLHKCEQHFNSSDFDFFVRYVMAKKSTFSTHRPHKSLNFNPSLSLWSAQDFELKAISPFLFLQKRQKPFAQNQHPKQVSGKEKKNRMATTPMSKHSRTIELKDYNLFSLQKRMKEKKKCLKTQIRQIESTFREQKRMNEPEYSFRRKFKKRKLNQTQGNYFTSPKYQRIEPSNASKGCQVPFQLLVPLEIDKKLRLKHKHLTQRNMQLFR